MVEHRHGAAGEVPGQCSIPRLVLGQRPTLGGKVGGCPGAPLLSRSHPSGIGSNGRGLTTGDDQAIHAMSVPRATRHVLKVGSSPFSERPQRCCQPEGGRCRTNAAAIRRPPLGDPRATRGLTLLWGNLPHVRVGHALQTRRSGYPKGRACASGRIRVSGHGALAPTHQTRRSGYPKGRACARGHIRVSGHGALAPTHPPVRTRRFGPSRQLPDDAPLLDRVVAFAGRYDWSPQ